MVLLRRLSSLSATALVSIGFLSALIHSQFGLAADDSTTCSSDLEPSVACSTRQLRMNDLQMIGSHNSYKQAIPAAELELIREANPRSAMTLDYYHAPLVEQLDLGLRQIELDIVYDPEGGRYVDPLLPRLVAATNSADALEDAYSSEGMDAPGFKVLHAQDIDVRTHCKTWIECLDQIKDWSERNPTHSPLLIMFNAKEGGNSYPGTIEALKFTPEAYAALENEILKVFARDKLIVPDDIRAGHSTLREGVIENGWPLLEDVLGKVFFALDEGQAKVEIYLGENKSAEGKLIFPNSVSEEADHAAYFTLNDPIGQQARIAAAVDAGFIVRTRADANTLQARENDTASREAAFQSGAHYISTDYYYPRLEFSDYSVALPGGSPARLNPVRQQ
jgi:hypothetical protein